jgi:hypothetical protein
MDLLCKPTSNRERVRRAAERANQLIPILSAESCLSLSNWSKTGHSDTIVRIRTLGVAR